MGLNPLPRLARALGRHAWLMRLAPMILPLDRLLHRVTGPDLDEIWALAVRGWPGYEVERRLAGREFRLFVLTPRP